MEVKVNYLDYQILQDVADEYRIEVEDLFREYKNMLDANFEQDLHNLAKELKNENE